MSLLMAEAWSDRVKDMRGRLKVNQMQFSALLGFDPKSVRRWEQGRRKPERYSLLILELLSKSIGAHSRESLLKALRHAGPEPLPMVRMLTWLERNPSIPQVPLQ